MKYIAYIRKSTEGNNRQIQSIPKQYNWVKREAARRGITISLFFEDKKSGHTLGREGFENMVQTIEASDQPVGIITWKISRLSRNPIDEGIIKYAFMRGKIKHIISRDREYKEGESQIIMGVDFGQATQYSINLSKDVKDGLLKKIEKGFMPNKAPYGYLNDSQTQKGNRKILIDPLYFPIIQRFLKEYLKGIYSVPELQKIMTKNWGVMTREGKPFSLGTLYFILKKRFYCGEFVWSGKIYKGKHKPMITVREFEQIQQILHRKQKVSANKYENHYSGCITCGDCMSAITGYSKVKNTKSKGIATYHYLKCTRSKKGTCNEKNINRNTIDDQFLELLESIELPKKVIAFLIKSFHKRNKGTLKKMDSQKRELQKQVNTLESQLENLTVKLSKNILADELFQKMSTKIEKEKSRIQEKLTNMSQKRQKEKINAFFDFLEKIKNKFIHGTYLEKKKILQTIGSNYKLKNGILLTDVHKPFKVIQKVRKHLGLRNHKIEPQNDQSRTSLIGDSCTGITRWYRDIEELRTAIMDDDFFI